MRRHSSVPLKSSSGATALSVVLLVLRLRDVRNETLDYPGLPPTTNNSQGTNLQWSQQLNSQWDFALTLANNRVQTVQAGTFNASVIDAYLGMFGVPGAFGQATQDVYGYRMGQQFESTVLSPSLTGKFTTGTTQHTVTAGLDHEVSKEDSFMRWSDPLNMGLSFITANVNLAGTTYATWIDPAGNSMFDSAYVRNFKATTAYAQDQMQLGNWSLLGSLRVNQLEIENNTAGNITNFGLHIVALLRSQDYAKAVQLYLEYDPAPPFDAGSPEKAPKIVNQFLGDMFAGLRDSAFATARRVHKRTIGS